MNAPKGRRYIPRVRENKDYESKLSEFRVAAGLTVKDICEKSGIRPSEYTVLNSGQRSPIGKDGKPIAQAIKLCTTLGTELSDLWPRYFCNIDHSNEYPSDQIIESFHSGMNSDTPEQIYERKELAIELLKIVNSLKYKEKKAILRLNKTLDQIGEEMEGMTRERVRQLESMAYDSVRSKIKRSENGEIFEFLNL